MGEYLIVDSLPALVGLAQMNVLEIHTWNSCFADIELAAYTRERIPRNAILALERM